MRTGLECSHFGECGSCKHSDYAVSFANKTEFVKTEFEKFLTPNGVEISLFQSPRAAFRVRAEFRVFHDEDGASWAMNGSAGGFVKVKSCAIVAEKIARLMPPLLEKVNSNSNLAKKLFGVEFFSTNERQNGLLCVLLYHKNVEEIQQDLAVLAEFLEREFDASLIARSRGKKLLFGSENLTSSVSVNDKNFKLKFSGEAFSQPNAFINEKMLFWVSENFLPASREEDLLELYCGHGNFTLPLSQNFHFILANEISKNSVSNALANASDNGVENIFIARMSSEELMQALAKKREFNRLKGVNVDKFNFTNIFLDPPRAGCDAEVLKFAAKMKQIAYISCNPLTLKRDLEILSQTHFVKKMALFDQFAYTNHIECGVILEKKEA